MATQPLKRPFTYQDYLELPDDRNRYEILDGELVVSPAPSTGHQDAATVLTAVVFNHVENHGLGKVFVAPTDVYLSETAVVQPDLLFVSRERLGIIQTAYVKGPPDLVIEILSPSTAYRDRGKKMQIYAEYGVLHYWLVDTRRRTSEVYVLIDGEYEQVAVGSGSQQFSAAPFPDLVISLERLWG